MSFAQLQTCLLRTLLQCTPLTDVVGDNIYISQAETVNSSGEAVKPPYVVLGEDTATDWSTKTSYGDNIVHTLHVWTGSKFQAKQLLSHIKTALRTPVPMAEGFRIKEVQYESMNVFTDALGSNADDRQLEHGVLMTRFYIQEGADIR